MKPGNRNERFFIGWSAQTDAFAYAWKHWKRGRKVTLGRDDKGVWSVKKT